MSLFSESLNELQGAVNRTISDGPTMDTLSSEWGWDFKENPAMLRVYEAIHELSDALKALEKSESGAP